MKVTDPFGADLPQVHQWAIDRHRDWKQRSTITDAVATGKWAKLWKAVAPGADDPLIENVYLEALEDKAASAASLQPSIHVAASLGTRNDRAEKEAAKKRKVFVSYSQRSDMEKLAEQLYLDWFQHGAMFVVPWTVWSDKVRFPFFIRQDARHAFPLAHDSQGKLSAIMFVKQRRMVDIEQEWGADNPAVRAMNSARNGIHGRDPSETVEEVWYYDSDRWGVAVYDGSITPDRNGTWRYRDPGIPSAGGGTAFWVAELEDHGLGRCPVRERKRSSVDGEYRGALDSVVPQLKIAHQLMDAVLDDVAQQIGAPVILNNIVNPEDFGPNAVLEGDGNGAASAEALRMPVNFEANQHITNLIEQSRRLAKHPQQRSGEAGASIVSAKGSNALMGSFNAEMAQAQRDYAKLFEEILSVTAAFDVAYCDTRKQIMGFDDGEAFSDTYTPSTVFKNDDYRVRVSFGGGLGMEMQSYNVQLATMRNMDSMSKRRFMQMTNLIENPLNEEREIALENIADGFLAHVMEQAASGNMQPLWTLAQNIDGDKYTAREAIFKSIQESLAVPAGGGGTPGPEAGPGDPLLQNRSMMSGGIPGMAEGQPGPPSIGAELRQLLPSRVARAEASVAEGAG